jgi:hypothetical protein
MFSVDHGMRHLAEEFMRNPLGEHSPELQRVLALFRSGPAAGKLVLVCTKPFEEWTLAEVTGIRGKPVKLLGDQVFTSIEDTERAAFRLRWKKHTGRALDV